MCIRDRPRIPPPFSQKTSRKAGESSLAGCTDKNLLFICDYFDNLYHQGRRESKGANPGQLPAGKRRDTEGAGKERYQQDCKEEHGSNDKGADGVRVGKQPQFENGLSASGIETVPQSGETEGDVYKRQHVRYRGYAGDSRYRVR